MHAAQQKVESTHSPLAYDLKESLKAASSMYQTLSGEIADGQRKVMAVATASLSPGFTEKVEAKRALSRKEQPSRPGFYVGGGRGVGCQANISSGSCDHQMQPSAGPAYSGYGRPSYGGQSSQSATRASSGPNANVNYGEYGSYGSAYAGYGGDLGGQSPGYGLTVGYGSYVLHRLNLQLEGMVVEILMAMTPTPVSTAAAGRFRPGDATSGDPGGGYKGQTGHSSAAWRRSDSCKRSFRRWMINRKSKSSLDYLNI